MSISPLITFKAGKCELDVSFSSLSAEHQADYACRLQASRTRSHRSPSRDTYIYTQKKVSMITWYLSSYADARQDLIHFCWRGRNVPLDEPELDLMILQDARFEQYNYKTSDQPTSRTNGRIFVLRFLSSSQRYLFWLQSKPQGSSPSWFSPRDIKIGHIVDDLLQGENVNVAEELSMIPYMPNQDEGDGDGDETMEDAEGHGHRGSVSGGAGADASGGDMRADGSASREGGADGGRA